MAADCHCLGSLPSARLLLHRNAALHWFILVPEGAESADLLDLPAPQLATLMSDAKTVASFLKDELGYPRVNLAALGLVVPQLHLHVVGRREGDSCWPAPVWGNLAMQGEYTADQLSALRAALSL